MSIRIIIADDHKIVREGLRALIEKKASMEIVAEAGDGRTAVRLSKELLPDVVVMDVAMPDLNGIEATRQIVAKSREVKVLALSMHSDRRFVVEMFKAGTAGYLLKDCAFEEMETAIRTVAAKRLYLSPKLTDLMMKDYVLLFPGSEISGLAILTPREREVLQLLAEGKKTTEIASILKVSIKTIETHRNRIMERLGTRSIAELTKYAIREGLTSLED